MLVSRYSKKLPMRILQAIPLSVLRLSDSRRPFPHTSSQRLADVVLQSSLRTQAIQESASARRRTFPKVFPPPALQQQPGLRSGSGKFLKNRLPWQRQRFRGAVGSLAGYRSIPIALPVPPEQWRAFQRDCWRCAGGIRDSVGDCFTHRRTLFRDGRQLPGGRQHKY